MGSYSMWCIWFLSLTIMFWRCIHAIAYISLHFFLLLNNVPIMYHILFIHSLVHGHLGCFHLLVILNNAGTYKFSCGHMFSVLLGDIARSGIARSYGKSMFNPLFFWLKLFDFLLIFSFFIEVQLIYNVVLVSGVQQSDSVIHIRIPSLFQILFYYRLLQDTEYSSLCYTVGPCCLSILDILVCLC